MKRVLKIGIFLLVIVLGLILPSSALSNPYPQEPPPPHGLQEAPKRPAPLNPPSPRTGFIPPSIDLSHLTGQRMPEVFMSQAPPSSFDWRTQSKVTSVKNQGPCGSCYAFAAIGNFESKTLIDGAYTLPDPNFSENNAKECNWREANNYVDSGGCDGGNYHMLASLFSQKGVVLESCDPYVANDTGSCNSSCAYQKTLLDWRIISGNVVPSTDVLKSYIYNYGPVYTTLYAGKGDAWDTEFDHYDGSYTLYYTGAEPINHAVLIVGWNDSLTHAGGTGGWIVKNSWGTGWGAAGYFTIAYGSASIGKYSSFMHDWQDYDTSGGIMYYDDDRWSTSWGYSGSTTGWGLVKFFPSSNTYVTRVEFWTTDITTDVDVYIYENFDGTTLSNLLRSVENHSFSEAGYHSVAVSPLAVSSGDDVIAVVKFTNSSYDHPVAADRVGPSETGRTYISRNGISPWTDLGAHDNDDVAIRLRTSAGPGFTEKVYLPLIMKNYP